MIENSFGSRQEEGEEEEYDDDDGAATPLQQSGIDWAGYTHSTIVETDTDSGQILIILIAL